MFLGIEIIFMYVTRVHKMHYYYMTRMLVIVVHVMVTLILKSKQDTETLSRCLPVSVMRWVICRTSLRKYSLNQFIYKATKMTGIKVNINSLFPFIFVSVAWSIGCQINKTYFQWSVIFYVSNDTPLFLNNCLLLNECVLLFGISTTNIGVTSSHPKSYLLRQ